MEKIDKFDELKKQFEQFAKSNEVLRVDDGIRMFYIRDDGSVSTPSQSVSLTVSLFDRSQTRSSSSSSSSSKVAGFVRVDSWSYDLIPHESTVMKSDSDSYIFPNDESQSQLKCSFIGISLGNRVDAQKKVQFENILAKYGRLMYQNNDQPAKQDPNEFISDVSDSELLDDEKKKQTWRADDVANSLVTGAQYASHGIATTAEYANKALKLGADKLKTQIQPNEQSTQVDPKVKSTLQSVQNGTLVGFRVASTLVSKLTSLASYTAETFGPSFREGSTTLLTKSGLVADKTVANGYVDNVCTLAKGSLKSYGIIYDSLAKAAGALSKNFAENTVEVVERK